MGNSNNRAALGCFLVGSLGLAICVAVIAAACGFLLGSRGLELSHGPGIAIFDILDELNDEQYVLAQLETLEKNPDTKAVVLRVDSPGGVITVVEEIYKGLKRAKEKGIPIVASIGSTAASGGYFVCLGADRIFANRSSVTGSIGVLVEYYTAQELFNRLGVKSEAVTSGEFKGMGGLAETLTDRQREMMQGIVNEFRDFFIETVATERHLDIDRVRKLADGRIFTGVQARDAGLIDEIGDLDAAVDYAAKLAGIEGEPRIFHVGEKKFSFIAEWLNSLGIPPWGKTTRRDFSARVLMR